MSTDAAMEAALKFALDSQKPAKPDWKPWMDKDYSELQRVLIDEYGYEHHFIWEFAKNKDKSEAWRDLRNFKHFIDCGPPLQLDEENTWIILHNFVEIFDLASAKSHRYTFGRELFAINSSQHEGVLYYGEHRHHFSPIKIQKTDGRRIEAFLYLATRMYPAHWEGIHRDEYGQKISDEIKLQSLRSYEATGQVKWCYSVVVMIKQAPKGPHGKDEGFMQVEFRVPEYQVTEDGVTTSREPPWFWVLRAMRDTMNRFHHLCPGCEWLPPLQLAQPKAVQVGKEWPPVIDLLQAQAATRALASTTQSGPIQASATNTAQPTNTGVQAHTGPLKCSAAQATNFQPSRVDATVATGVLPASGIQAPIVQQNGGSVRPTAPLQQSATSAPVVQQNGSGNSAVSLQRSSAPGPMVQQTNAVRSAASSQQSAIPTPVVQQNGSARSAASLQSSTPGPIVQQNSSKAPAAHLQKTGIPAPSQQNGSTRSAASVSGRPAASLQQSAMSTPSQQTGIARPAASLQQYAIPAVMAAKISGFTSRDETPVMQQQGKQTVQIQTGRNPYLPQTPTRQTPGSQTSAQSTSNLTPQVASAPARWNTPQQMQSDPRQISTAPAVPGMSPLQRFFNQQFLRQLAEQRQAGSLGSAASSPYSSPLGNPELGSPTPAPRSRLANGASSKAAPRQVKSKVTKSQAASGQVKSKITKSQAAPRQGMPNVASSQASIQQSSSGVSPLGPPHQSMLNGGYTPALPQQRMPNGMSSIGPYQGMLNGASSQASDQQMLNGASHLGFLRQPMSNGEFTPALPQQRMSNGMSPMGPQQGMLNGASSVPNQQMPYGFGPNLPRQPMPNGMDFPGDPQQRMPFNATPTSGLLQQRMSEQDQLRMMQAQDGMLRPDAQYQALVNSQQQSMRQQNAAYPQQPNPPAQQQQGPSHTPQQRSASSQQQVPVSRQQQRSYPVDPQLFSGLSGGNGQDSFSPTMGYGNQFVPAPFPSMGAGVDMLQPMSQQQQGMMGMGMGTAMNMGLNENDWDLWGEMTKGREGMASLPNNGGPVGNVPMNMQMPMGMPMGMQNGMSNGDMQGGGMSMGMYNDMPIGDMQGGGMPMGMYNDMSIGDMQGGGMPMGIYNDMPSGGMQGGGMPMGMQNGSRKRDREEETDDDEPETQRRRVS